MIRIYGVLFVGILSVSLASILIKFANDVPAVIMSAYRLSISSFVLLILSITRDEKVLPDSRKDFFLAVLGGFFLSLHFISWIASIKFTSIPSSVTLVSTSPVFVMLFSVVLFRQKQDLKSVLAVIAAVVGSALISSADGGIFSGGLDRKALFGDGLALVGAFAVAVYFMVGAFLRRKMDIFRYITLVYGFSAIFTLIFALFSGESFVGYKATSYICMVLLALVPQLVGHTSFNWALKHLKADAVAISTLGEPIGASILAYFIFSQIIGFYQFIGMVIVFISIVIAVKGGYEKID